MKHRTYEKVKLEHQIIDKLRPILKIMATIPEIETIIPGRIKGNVRGSCDLCLKIQYEISTGFKCLAHSKNSIQEVFVVVKKANRQLVKDKLDNLFRTVI